MLFVAGRFRLPIRGLRGMPDLTSFAVFDGLADKGVEVDALVDTDRDEGECTGSDVDACTEDFFELSSAADRFRLPLSVFF